MNVKYQLICNFFVHFYITLENFLKLLVAIRLRRFFFAKKNIQLITFQYSHIRKKALNVVLHLVSKDILIARLIVYYSSIELSVSQEVNCSYQYTQLWASINDGESVDYFANSWRYFIKLTYKHRR